LGSARRAYRLLHYYRGMVWQKGLRAGNSRAPGHSESIMRTLGRTALTLFWRPLGFIEFLDVALKFRRIDNGVFIEGGIVNRSRGRNGGRLGETEVIGP